MLDLDTLLLLPSASTDNMFSQQTNISNFSSMECCEQANLYGQITDQNYVIRNSKIIWPESSNQPVRNHMENSHKFSEMNTFYTQFISTKSNNEISKTIPDSWRQQASIADWKAYLYTSNPGKNIDQIPENTTNNDVRNSVKNATQQAAPRAHISFVHTTDGKFKPIVKRKRKRTTFTTEQVEVLERIFYKRPYVSREERQLLMETLQVSDKAIKVWFQNRRLKVKKEREEQVESSDSEIVSVPETKPLAYVESQIYKADEFGYVTLDDRAINELVDVIDNFLPKDAVLDDTSSDNRLCSVSESESSAIYEPISPPDLSDNTSQEFSQRWETFEAIEPKLSLQRLLDVHMHDYKESDSCVF